METLRKLSSMGRSKESKEAAGAAVEKASNGGGEEGIDNEPAVAPSPPRARVTVDDNDEAEEVVGGGGAGDGGSYSSAVKKMASSTTTTTTTTTTASVVEEAQAVEAAESPRVSARLEEEEEGDGSEKEGNGNGASSSSSSSSSEDEEEPNRFEAEGDDSEVSVRAMPVAKLTTENEEQEEEEEDVDEENQEEVDNEDDYEEATDEALGEEEDASSGAVDVTSPRIIARESVDEDYDLAMKEDSNTSPAVEEDLEQAASTPLPDQEGEKSAISDATQSSPPVAEEETGAEEADDLRPLEGKSVEPVTGGAEETAVVEEKREEEEVEADLAQAVTSAAEPAVDETGVKEEVAPEVVPLATADVGNAPKESEVEETEHASVPPKMDVESRGASSSLLEELRKLREQTSLKEVKPAVATGSALEEPSQSVAEKDFESTDSKYVAKGAASDDLLGEMEKVTDARLGKEAGEPSDELTDAFHMQGRPEGDASEVPPEVAGERIVEVGKVEESDSAISKDELSKEVVEDSGVVPSPAHLYSALKAVDDETPALKSENGNLAEAENVQSKPEAFSAVDFTGDSDADAEGGDDENDDDVDEDDEDEDETDMDTARALAELANAVGKSGNASDGGNKPSMGAAGPSLPSLPQRPAARKPAAASALDTAGRITTRSAAASSTQLTTTSDENANGETAEGNETREKLQNIRVKFLRLAHRLGQSPQNVVVSQVLYRLGLAESLRGGSAPNRTGAFSFDRANALAEEQEAANQDEELDFACTILVLGKTGVGKSATINSIFDDRKTVTSAFKPSTNNVQEIVGTVHGIKVRVIDTPGLLPSVADQQHNERTMGQIKKHIKKQSPDIVLYFDRLDMQSRDYGDLPLLRTITDLFGAAVWFNAIVVLTHASSAPPDGPNGVPLSYEMFVAQRSHVVQQTIRQAAGDMRLMNPVSLVENHPACRTNRYGQRVLPNGQIWKPQLLLLCFASKILAEANSLLKLQETATPGRPFGQRSRVPPLPFLLSSLLQSRAQLKLPDEQLGESDESDDDEEDEDSDADDYDELPPFRPLSKEELEELSKEQRQDYMDELADRERLFQKKQYREEMRRRKEMKKRAAQMSKEELAQPDEADDEAGKAAAVPVPMPDMALPPSFDSDNPTHRYRYLETANQWLVRPVLETHGWDHDAGYDGFNVEKAFVVKDKIPASISGQITKDKKESQVNFEAAASLKHGEGKVTLTGFDIQTIGKDLAYTLRAETRFNNFRRNKTTGGVTCTVLNDTVAAGLKLEDRILIGKRVKVVVNGGVLTGKGDKAFGGSLEATLRGKEYPLSRTLSTLGLSVMDWHGDLAIGGNLQSQVMVGKTMLVGRANLNNRGSGQVSIRASSSEQLQMVLIGIVPILRSLINCRFGFGGQPSQ